MLSWPQQAPHGSRRCATVCRKWLHYIEWKVCCGQSQALQSAERKEVVGGKAGSKARPSVTLGGFAGLLCLILARQRWQN